MRTPRVRFPSPWGKGWKPGCCSMSTGGGAGAQPGGGDLSWAEVGAPKAWRRPWITCMLLSAAGPSGERMGAEEMSNKALWVNYFLAVSLQTFLSMSLVYSSMFLGWWRDWAVPSPGRGRAGKALASLALSAEAGAGAVRAELEQPGGLCSGGTWGSSPETCARHEGLAFRSSTAPLQLKQQQTGSQTALREVTPVNSFRFPNLGLNRDLPTGNTRAPLMLSSGSKMQRSQLGALAGSIYPTNLALSRWCWRGVKSTCASFCWLSAFQSCPCIHPAAVPCPPSPSGCLFWSPRPVYHPGSGNVPGAGGDLCADVELFQGEPWCHGSCRLECAACPLPLRPALLLFLCLS
nr:uncharacterized protein LOC125182196 [Anser cygnoides]